MTALVRSAIVVVLATLVFGFAYPAIMTGFASVAFPGRSTGSLIHNKNGHIVGSRLAAQNFTQTRYFHSRPSGTAPAYNAGATTFLNLGPTSPDFVTIATAAITSTIVGTKSAPSAASLISRASIFLPSHSGVLPTISPAMKTAMMM